MIENDVSRRKEEGKALVRRCPRVKDSLSERLQEMEEIWSSLLEKANQRRQRLQQAEAVQRYLTEWRELMYAVFSFSGCFSCVVLLFYIDVVDTVLGAGLRRHCP